MSLHALDGGGGGVLEQMHRGVHLVATLPPRPLHLLDRAVHAVALATAGATSLMHEAKVDVVTVSNLSEHLSSADTTAQLSARFA